ncbi:hypothetical protein ACFO1B_21545 [Dactylosporangium siamense]|uniref:Lipoprotein n=1 Tax=Dactylosporangium siamense TaxID=685454 RepID=A0A919UCV4_9ACTN|nr:hypothetical protein [Dactylosporangium siamense]GIG50772.1 hypothetical protein Dsi01nite_088130 [Dactylosporangium siamense]
MRAGWLVPVVVVLGLAGCTHRSRPAPVPSPSVAAGRDPLFVCGRGVWADDLAGTRDALTVAIASVRRVSADTAPEVTLRFTATTELRVEIPPVEVLYLKESVIVGGGPMLNQPGDLSPQTIAEPGTGFEVRPGAPVEAAVGTRTLCPAFTWPKLWSAPERVAVMVVVGHLEPRGGGVVLDVPGPGVPLLAASAELPR